VLTRRSASWASDVPDGVIEAYEAVVDQVDLESIAARERVTRHDVKARIEEFSALAGHEHIHKGMTSRDLTENVEQLQMRARWSSCATAVAAAGPPGRAGRRARDHRDGRALAQRRRPGHHAGQAVRLGRRGAAASRLNASRLIDALPAARHQGPDGHQPDMLDLLDGDRRSWPTWSAAWPRTSASTNVLTSVGQVYPRSLDFDVVSALVQLVSGPSSWPPRSG
jgi:adenylosuccinate lyase